MVYFHLQLRKTLTEKQGWKRRSCFRFHSPQQWIPLRRRRRIPLALSHTVRSLVGYFRQQVVYADATRSTKVQHREIGCIPGDRVLDGRVFYFLPADQHHNSFVRRVKDWVLRHPAWSVEKFSRGRSFNPTGGDLVGMVHHSHQLSD